MVYTLKLPRLGEGIFEAQVVNLFAKEGMSISEGFLVADMQTDKAAGELQSPVDGVIQEVLMKEGQFAYQGDPLVLIDDGSDTPPDLENRSGIYTGPSNVPSKKKAKKEKSQATEKPKESKKSAAQSRVVKQKKADPAKSVPANEQPKPAPSASAPASTPDYDELLDSLESSFKLTLFNHNHENEKRKVRAMLNTRSYAKEKGIDIDQIIKTDDEPVKKEDIDALIKKNQVKEPENPFIPIDQYNPNLISKYPDLEERVELNYIRKFNASSYEMQHRIATPFTVFETVDMSKMIELLNESAEEGIQLESYLPLVVKALVNTAIRYPKINASIDDTVAQFVYKKYYSVGIDINTVQGMFTPVIHNADKRSITKIAEDVAQLTKDIQNRRFEWKNISDATITITDNSNLNSKAGFFTPMIHHPQVACLGLGTVQDLPVVYEGEVVAQTSLPISLTVDYRVVDRPDAFAAMAHLKDLLENPKRILFNS